MESHCISYRDTGAFSPAVIGYLENDPKLQPFCSFPPTLEGFKQAIAARKQPSNRAALAATIEKQYAFLLDKQKVDESVRANISLLNNPSTYTVTTGHQLNIFTGPLYFIYKIVTAINLCKELAIAFPEKKFVPVYWMATEDHDFGEIDHLFVDGHPLRWEREASGATGRLDTETITEVVAAYKAITGTSPFSEELGKIMDDAYSESLSLAGATRSMVNALFGKYGLVILDADDPALKKEFAPIMAREMLEMNSFREINGASAALEQAGFKTQVNARELNFFYLKDAIRERITFEGGTYFVLNTEIRFTPHEITAEIHSYPERFSPNVMLRPLYQEVVLPNLAYVGGGAELVYWLQLKRNFDFYGIDFPVLILRNSAAIVDAAASRDVKGLALTWADLFMSADEVAKKWIRSNTAHDLSVDTEWVKLNEIFDQLISRITVIDATLGPSAAAIRARLRHALDNLEKKLVKKDKVNHFERLEKLEALRERLFPGGALQERRENFGPFYARQGQAFIDELVRHLKPLDFEFSILEI